jgi:glutathione S-transferase
VHTAGLRHVAHALVSGVDQKQAGDHALRVSSSRPADQPAYDTGAVQLAAGYLRDRVGVPRDLSLPAARQLRAHCNWLIESLAAA